MKKRWMIGAAVAALLAGGSAMAEPLKVGAVVPMTGDLQAYGDVSRKGVELAVELINKDGGVLGAPVELVVGDTQTNPQQGVDAAQKLVTVNGADALVGALSSGVTIPVAQSVAKVEGVPQISGASTSPVITTLDDDDFLFRTVPSDAFQGVALAEVAKEAGADGVAVMYVNNDYGKGLAENFAKAFEKAGGKVTESVPFEKNQASYRGELQKAAGGGDADRLLLIAYPESGTTILRQALEGGFFDSFLFSDGLKANELPDNIGGGHLDGTLGTSPKAMATDATNAFHDAWLAKYGSESEKPYHDNIFDATMLIALAAQKAGSTDPKAIRDALRDVANPPGEQVGPADWAKAVALLKAGKDIDYVGAAGSQNFDDQGDVAGTFELFEIKDGKINQVRVFEPKM